MLRSAQWHLRTRPLRMALILASFLLLTSSLGWSDQPSPAAVDAYQRAVAGIEQHAERNWPAHNPPQTCPVGQPGADDVFVQRLPVQDSAGKDLSVRDALVHHWRAMMLIPGVGPGDVAAVLSDYNHHAQVYGPELTASKILDHNGSRYRVLHETLTRSVITVGLRIESVMDWHMVTADDWWSHAAVVRVTEMEHAGTPHATERTPQQAKGWLWRMDSWWHVTAQKNGTCVTYENISLTRDVPWGLGWILRPIVTRFPAETLTTMLRRTRNAVVAERAKRAKTAAETGR